MAGPIELTWNEALSGIWGSISLAAWIVIFIPQLAENYKQGNADGISLAFLFIWMVGDITNLAGAIWAKLVPTVIAIAVYFCFSDVLLIGQCVYYNEINRRKRKNEAVTASANGEVAGASEQTPLLNGNPSPSAPPIKRRLTDVTDENMGRRGSRRRSSASARRTASDAGQTTLERILEEPTIRSAWIKNIVSILMVCLAGAAGWAIAWKSGAWKPTPVGREDRDSEPVGAEILGYISAVCYLGARIPQIIKNQRERSCEGLSLLFFLLSLLGNATYGAGVSTSASSNSYCERLTCTCLDSIPLSGA